MKRRIYTDTSVIGGCLDVEFKGPSLQLMNHFSNGSAIIIVSDLTRLELEKAPDAVRAVLRNIPDAYKEYVELTSDAAALAERYIAEGVIGQSMRIDAQHIAVATLSRADVLVSWNFKHIVNLDRIHGYNSVNLRFGYPPTRDQNASGGAQI
jgi:hypothetical protein